jgi:lauroyl/myristoyl acyltransferase
LGLDQSYLSYYLYRLAGAIFPHIPPRWGYPLTTCIGDLAYHLMPGQRACVRDNIRHVLDASATPAQVERTVRQVYHNIAANYYDLFRQPTLSFEEINRLVTLEGWEHVEPLVKRKEGFILTTAHFGGFEIVAQACALQGVFVAVPAEHLRPERLFRYIAGLRMSKGLHVIPIDGPLLELFRVLRRGEIVGLAADRDITNTGLVIDFFGAPGHLPRGYADLALRTGAPIVVGFGYRQPDHSFLTCLEPPLYLEQSGDHERDVRAGVARVVSIMEHHIASHPEQWVLTYPIWRKDGQ